MTKLDALVKAGEEMAFLFDGYEAGLVIRASMEDRFLAAVSSWRSALADLRAEEQPVPSPSRVLCPICSPGRCRCEEDRR